MKKISLFAGVIAISLTSAAASFAAPDTKADQDGNRAMSKAEAVAAADARFAKMDANNDGQLNEADKVAKMRERFAAIDSDKNGAISESEFIVMHEARADRRGDRREKRIKHGKMGAHSDRHDGAMAMMAQTDSNGDKAISRAEFRAAAEARFAKADANKDGIVTVEERRAGRKANWRGIMMSPAQPDAG
jgi:Ca2+-binding EF-hand superfamily protein